MYSATHCSKLFAKCTVDAYVSPVEVFATAWDQEFYSAKFVLDCYLPNVLLRPVWMSET